RCNWSSVTPKAITISPVKTRLARAKALELRSNICAMNAFLIRFRLRVVRCALCWRPPGLRLSYDAGQTTPERWGNPKVQYNSQRGCATISYPLRIKKFFQGCQLCNPL